jgi:hypothetical protein
VSKNKKAEAPINPKAIDASIALVAKAALPFANIVRMDSQERSRVAKLKRGATQVFPTIAYVAKKFALEVPGSSIDDMMSKIAHAQALEPMLGAVADLHAALRDEYLRSQSEAWLTATVTYGVLRKASEANHSIRTELAPVRAWFRHKGNNGGSKPVVAEPAVTEPAAPTAVADATPKA